MNRDDLKELAEVSKALLSWREELERYNTEPYLNNENNKPWITVSVGNHPTYLREFVIAINNPEARQEIKRLMIAELKTRVRSLETKLRHLKGKK